MQISSASIHAIPVLNICIPKRTGKITKTIPMTVNIIKQSDFLFVGGIKNFDMERNNNPIVTMKTINGKYNPYPNIVVDRKLYS